MLEHITIRGWSSPQRGAFRGLRGSTLAWIGEPRWRVENKQDRFKLARTLKLRNNLFKNEWWSVATNTDKPPGHGDGGAHVRARTPSNNGIYRAAPTLVSTERERAHSKVE